MSNPAISTPAQAPVSDTSSGRPSVSSTFSKDSSTHRFDPSELKRTASVKSSHGSLVSSPRRAGGLSSPTSAASQAQGSPWSFVRNTSSFRVGSGDFGRAANTTGGTAARVTLTREQVLRTSTIRSQFSTARPLRLFSGVSVQGSDDGGDDSPIEDEKQSEPDTTDAKHVRCVCDS